MTEQTTTNELHAAIADLSGEVIALVRYGEDVREVEEDAAGVAIPEVPSNQWKDAVLDHLAICCLDAPQDEPPYKIIGRILDWHVAVATDPAVNGGFKLVPVDDGVKEGANG